MAKIGFIGLGRMGAPMARNLARAGHDVRGFDIDAGARRRAQRTGLGIASSVAETLADAAAAITMLPTAAEVRSVYDALLDAVGERSLLIEASTIDVETARALHGEAAERGVAMVDAPVSGGVAGAEAGTLTFMVGGSARDFRAARPILRRMGRTVVHAGDAGAGQAAKICNNLILGVSMIAVCEAFALAGRLGLDPRALFEISARASGQCWSLTEYCPVPGMVPSSPANRDYKAGFTAAMMLKDLRLAEAAAIASGAASPLGAHAAALYALFCNDGNAQVDFSGIFRMIAADRSSSPSPRSRA